MIGLEKILDEISRETDVIVSKIELEAREKADAIRRNGDVTAEKKLKEIKQAAENKKQENLKRSKSAAELEKRKRILIAKQDIISSVINKAKQNLINAEDKQYFNNIIKMVEKYSLSRPGEIIFNSKDLKRLPYDFQKKIDAVVSKKGGTLKISKDTRDIDGGFILSYVEIEENCSFTALFNSADDELKDLVYRLFFL